MMISRQNDFPDFIPSWAGKIKQWGLGTPAILFLEANKPLSFIFSQWLLVSRPMANLFFPSHLTDNAVSLFSNRNYLDYLIKELEKR